MKQRRFAIFRHSGALALAALLTFAVAPATSAGVEASVGPYEVELTTDPAVIPIGKARLILTITDRAGKPVTGADVRALTGMPGMFMGEKEVPATPQPGKPGVYTAPANFPMAGPYQTTVKISGPAGAATGVVPTNTGQNTAAAGGGFSVLSLLPWLALLALIAFVLYRVRRTGQRVNWRGVFNRQVLGGLVLLGAMLAGAIYAVNSFRRQGAMTPIEAQAMKMNTPAPPGVTPVALASVQRGTVAHTVRYTGQAVGYTEQNVYPRVRGYLTWMPLYEGDRVKRGQLLARLDTSEIEPEVAEREAATTAARQGVGVARADYEQAQAAVSQAQAELAGRQGAVTEARANLQAARAERTNAEADLAAARTQVADAEAGLEAARADQAYWQQQIKRTQELLKAGAVSGEEFQREQAQAQTADAKVRQAQARVRQVEAQVRAAESAVRKADAMIRSAEAGVRQAESELMAHHAHVRQTKAAMSSARQRIAQAQAGVAQARAAAEATATSQGYTKIYSQIDGVVTERLISPGVLVSPGQAILKLAQIHPIRLQANVAESDLERIEAGTPVTVRDRNGKSKPVEAKVTSIRPAVDPQARTGVVEAVVSNPGERFLPGEYVVMEITTGRREDALFVPSRTVQHRTLPSGGVVSADETSFVWVAEPAGGENQFTARRVEVQTGMSDGQKTVIRSGLDEGQRVVVSGYQYLANGDAVTPAGTTAASSDAAAGEKAMSGMKGKEGSSGTSATADSGTTQSASVAVTQAGYQPESLTLKPGVPARLTFVRKTDATCGTEVVLPAYDINKKLPLNEPVVVEFTPKEGEFTFTCGMDMLRGKVVVR